MKLYLKRVNEQKYKNYKNNLSTNNKAIWGCVVGINNNFMTLARIFQMQQIVTNLKWQYWVKNKELFE